MAWMLLFFLSDAAAAHWIGDVRASGALRLLGSRRDSLDLGIAMLHIDAAAGDGRRTWQWGEGKCIAHLLYEENT